MALRIISIVIAVTAFIAYSSIFVVDERQKALVLQFGQVADVKEEPGLAFKLPFIQQVVRYDDRILSLDTMPLEVTPLDDRRLVVDAFARYRIINVVQFRQAVGTGGIVTAESRLERILNAALREVLGSVTSNAVLSTDRIELMTRITESAKIESKGLGVEIVDVRIKRADLPTQNLAATFRRMQAERERMAADERARGQEAAQIVRAEADRKAVETVSEAKKEAEIIRGTADALTTKIFADAFGRDPEFYAFTRSLIAYEQSMTSSNTTMVISPNSEFFDYIKESEKE
ncbi:MAG: HflC protein [Rhodobacteraceae bacterium]|jgi:membrane protease subunit HflC|nr:HflC protein [Paracoccaceae bacterium]|tara:strand:+ start:17 stop:883 length:867 start_codon:yes stop_codon:yes gene_type:complete